MTRLIEEEEAFKALSAYYKHRTPAQDSALHDALSRVPTADTDMSGYSDRLWKLAYDLAYEKGKANAARHGKWIKADSQQYFRKHYPCFTCSECGYRKDSQKKWNYCPYCGSDMRGEE